MYHRSSVSITLFIVLSSIRCNTVSSDWSVIIIDHQQSSWCHQMSWCHDVMFSHQPSSVISHQSSVINGHQWSRWPSWVILILVINTHQSSLSSWVIMVILVICVIMCHQSSCVIMCHHVSCEWSSSSMSSWSMLSSDVDGHRRSVIVNQSSVIVNESTVNRKSS